MNNERDVPNDEGPGDDRGVGYENKFFIVPVSEESGRLSGFVSKQKEMKKWQ